MNNNKDESINDDDSELIFNRMDDVENIFNQPYIIQRDYYDNPVGSIIEYTHDSDLINNFLMNLILLIFTHDQWCLEEYR